MKKVLCNVLHNVKIPAYRNDLGRVSIDLGLFNEREDAECAGMLVKKILEAENGFGFLSVGNYDIQREYIPDSEMNNPMVVSRYNEDLEKFVQKNAYTNYYIEKFGATEFSMMVFDCLNQCMRSEDDSKKLKQKGE